MNTLQHVGISVSDLDYAVKFYTTMFEMEVAAQFPFAGEPYSQVMGLANVQGRMAVVRGGALMLELFEFARPTPNGRDVDHSVADRGLSHFGIEVSDIQLIYTRLREAGVRFHCPIVTFPSGIKATYGRDFDGNVFELLELPRSQPA